MKALPLIPLPQSVERLPEVFSLTENTMIVADHPDRANACYLQKRLSTATGFNFPMGSRVSLHPGIYLKVQPGIVDLGEEGYHLEVRRDAVLLEASTNLGLFYAIQTLLQLLPPEIEAPSPLSGIEWKILGIRIQDKPRFAWRGFMLDEGRHFQGKETVLKLLDVMAMLKMNIFHWHLTEDQGWRIEIQGYPRLTEIGSQRPGTAKNLLDMIRNRHDSNPQAGYYTQEDIRSIVAYAAARHITLVPEIEMPGHSLAALSAYPEFSCTGGPFEAATRFGIFRDIYCPGKEGTFNFLQNILDQIIDLFPGPFLHMGGDEAPKARWKGCPDCQQRISEKGLHNEQELQAYFTNRIAQYLIESGRTMIGWNEALNPDLQPEVIIQYWFRNRKEVIEAIRKGRKAIISSYLDYYLDHSYALTPLSRTYNFEPVFRELGTGEAQNVLGVEAPLWTEFVPGRARLDYQTFPRLLAVAETGWTEPTKKDFKDFSTRWAGFQRRLDSLGIRYARGREVEPSILKRMFGMFTLVQPSDKTA